MRSMTLLLTISMLVLLAIVLSTNGHRLAYAAASGLTYSEQCNGSSATVTFYWNGTNTSSQQWLDLSLQDNSWQPGTYLSAGPLPGGIASYTWTGLLSGNRHVVRVNQLSVGRWDTSTTWAFTPCSTPATPVPAVIVPLVPVQSSNCDPNYQGGTDTATGGCIRSGVGDYDCAGGSGNGPNYVRGPVYVIGRDIYDLDADHNGIGCQ